MDDSNKMSGVSGMKTWSKMAVLFAVLLLGAAFVAACGAAGDTNDEQVEEEAPENEIDVDEDAVEDNAVEDEDATEENDADEAVDADAAAQGEEIVQQSCISCHGNDLAGGSGPALIDVGDKFSDDELRDILVNGQGSMPGGLANGNEDEVIAYLQTLSE
jgi:cytochrome c551